MTLSDEVNLSSSGGQTVIDGCTIDTGTVHMGFTVEYGKDPVFFDALYGIPRRDSLSFECVGAFADALKSIDVPTSVCLCPTLKPHVSLHSLSVSPVSTLSRLAS